MSTAQDAIDLVYHEAALIDARRLDEWFELFTDDAIYWMPLARDQQETDLHATLFFEDKLLLKVRIERLKHPRAFSQAVPSYCQHVLQPPQVTGEAPIETATPFIYVEAQGDEQFMLAGVAHHELVSRPGGLKIRRKRVELLNREAALPSIQLFP